MKRLFSLLLCITTSVFIATTGAIAEDGFAPYPDKADMLIVFAHPDDESTFGGLIPYYAGGRAGHWGQGTSMVPDGEGRPGRIAELSIVGPRFDWLGPKIAYPSRRPRSGSLRGALSAVNSLIGCRAGLRNYPVKRFGFASKLMRPVFADN